MDDLGALPAGVFNVLVNTRQGPMLVNRNDRFVGRSLITYGEFSEIESSIFRQLVRPGDLVVEAGANIGAHTLLLSALVGPSGIVLAFEPQRIVFQTLCANLALNQCVNVLARQQGVGKKPGQMTTPAPDPRQENNFGGQSLRTVGEGEPVEVIPIDALGLPHCRLIKADVEGMEADVIQGAAATIGRCRPVLFLENDRPEQSSALLRLLFGLEYRLWWHITPLFNPDNFAGNSDNVFGATMSINILCQPAEAAQPVAGMREIHDPDAPWGDV